MKNRRAFEVLLVLGILAAAGNANNDENIAAQWPSSWDESSAYIFNESNSVPQGIELIMVHFKNSFKGTDQNVATIDRIYQRSDKYPYTEITNDSSDMMITSGTPLLLKEGYELAISYIDEMGMHLELAKNGKVIDSRIVIPPQAANNFYTYSRDIGYAKDIELIKVHFNNAFRDIDQNVATVDQIWQLSETNLSRVILNDSNKTIIATGTSLKLGEGYELAIKSTDIDGNKIYLELLKNGSVIDSSIVMPPITMDDFYTYSTNIGSAEDIELIKVHFRNAFRGADQNVATVDQIWQLSETNLSRVVINNSDISILNSSRPISLDENYELAIKSINFDENKVYVELSKNGTMIDPGIIILPRNPLCIESFNLYYRGKNDEALEMCNKSIEIDPWYAPAWLTKGFVLDNLKRHKDALKAYEKAAKIDSGYVSSKLSERGSSFFSQGDYVEATKAFDAAATFSPQSPSIWEDMGDALDRMGDFDEAIRSYNKARSMGNLSSIDMLGKGNSHYNLGEYLAAIRYYEEAIKQYPNDKDAWYNKANSLRMLHRNSEAEAAYAKARELGYSGAMTPMEMTLP